MTNANGPGHGRHWRLSSPWTHDDEERVVARARAAGIAVRGLSDYRVTPHDDAARDALPAALVIGFGNVTARQIRERIRVLGELVAA